MRGGTTSLYSYLTNTPSITPALRKEIRYFDWNYKKPWVWYVSHFPLKTTEGLLTGEASPNYIYFPEVAQRVSEKLPKVKLIAMLRDPVDRAYSHYCHEVAHGDEKLSFEDAIRRECIFDSDGFISKLRSMREKGPYEFDHFTYISRGIYAEQLKLWFEKMPREQFLILKSESFFNDPGDVLSKVLNFLGLPSSFDSSKLKKYNEGHYKPLGSETRSRLRKFYEPFNDELSQLLGMDFRSWKLTP
jgi:hypothetical protein